jgi:tetratricopeptide (TPR) repeat protein
MSTLRRLAALAPALTLALALGGCANGDNAGGDDQDLRDPSKASYTGPERRSQNLELEDFEFHYNDIDLSKSGEPDAFMVAQWRKARHEAALLCLRANPPDYKQARSLLEDVVIKVPSSSRDWALLAQLDFSDAAYWYQIADRVAWEMNRVAIEKTAEPNGPALDEKQLTELLESFRPFFDRANGKLKERAKAGLRHFEAYRRIRPDDKAVTDFVWKLYFYMQDFEKALQWLDYVLREMDLAEVPEEEPIRGDYGRIRESIISHLAEVKLKGANARPEGQGGLFPFSDEGSRSTLGRVGSDLSPGH